MCVADGRTCPFGSPGLRSKASWTYYFSVPLIKLLRLKLYFYKLLSVCALFLSFFRAVSSDSSFRCSFSEDAGGAELDGGTMAAADSLLQPIASLTGAPGFYTGNQGRQDDTITLPVVTFKIKVILLA